VPLSAPEAWTLRRFSELYYTGPAAGARPFEDTHWMGVPALKCPLDLWVYQELLFRLRPGLIVETGTRHGGTALYLAHLCDLLGRGRVASVDIEALPRPQHPRIRYLKGSSTDPGIVGAVAAMKEPGAGMLVILDSDHRCEHVLAELEHYGALLQAGDYLIVEDTNLNGHPVAPSHGPGPHEAVEAFLLRHPEFVRDRGCEKFLLTFNPGGFLQRRDVEPRPAGSGQTAVPEDPYRADEPDVLRSVAVTLERARLAETLLEQLARVTPAFQEAMQQLDAAQQASSQFKEAVASLDRARQREERLGAQLQEISAAFEEALRQLAVWKAVAEDLQNTNARQSEASEREAALAARVVALEQALGRAGIGVTERDSAQQAVSTTGKP
jgi:cephalosporin hydroxylase